MDYRTEKMNYCCQSSEEIKSRIMTWQINRGITVAETKRAFKDIYTYGKDILESEEFRATFSQTHHHVLSVGEHTLHVALYALQLSYDLQERGYDVSIKNVVIASLCHDLGIMGRYEKFSNNLVCCYLHPLHSAAIAKKLVPDLPRSVRKAISRHMFPATFIPPLSMTGYILIKADKACTLSEVWSQRKLFMRPLILS